MQNNKNLWIIIAVVVIAFIAYYISTHKDDSTGLNISSKDSVGEIIEEVGDEIDDNTTN